VPITFGDRVRSRCSDRGADDADVRAGEHGVEGGGELAVPITPLRRDRLGGLVHEYLEVQGQLVPTAGVQEPLPETKSAMDLVFKDIYRDEDAAEVLAAALPGLGETTPREIKGYLNLFRYYTFIVELPFDRAAVLASSRSPSSPRSRSDGHS
jgi:hypothetical protein